MSTPFPQESSIYFENLLICPQVTEQNYPQICSVTEWLIICKREIASYPRLTYTSFSMRGFNLHRIFHAGVILLFCTIFFISYKLIPNQSGIETHRQLNLPPCIFLKMTGLPCPSCGMTTSFSELAHGNIAGAFRSNPAGPMVFVLFLVLIGLSINAFAQNRPWNDIIDKKRFQSTAVFVIGIYIGIWIVRLLAATIN